MANEIKIGYGPDSAITADVFTPAGNEREFGINCAETAQGCLYLGDCATIQSGDVIVAYANGIYIGAEEYGLNAGISAQINAEVDSALNTAIPGSPTADSINERLKAIDDLLATGGLGDIALIRKLLKNKAVQTKSTGAVVYYDDDGVTPILTQTPTDAAATITRTPS